MTINPQATTTTPADYKYDGTATFNINPIDVEPSVCPITYSCSEDFPYFDGTCSFTSPEGTISSFNAASGALSFTSPENIKFGSQVVTFTITASVGLNSETFNVIMNLIDPCTDATLNLDPSIVTQHG